MAKDLFNRYIWLVDTIYRANGITFEEINDRWVRSSMSDGIDLPLKTFHNHRRAIEDMFDINIVCDKKNGYRYYIENADDMEGGGVRSWLLSTFAVNNLINESHHLKRRIVFEDIPSGQKYLTPAIEAMRDGCTLEMTYKSFWRQEKYSTEVKPYFVKVYGTQKEYFRTLPLHHSQQEIENEGGEEYTVFRYWLSPTYDFVQEILSHGYEVEVLSPGHLRDRIREIAEIILSR